MHTNGLFVKRKSLKMDTIDQWHMERWGKFTASPAYKLCVGDKSNFWSEGALTYIETKAMEAGCKMYERPELEEVKSLLHGKAHEHSAYVMYVNYTRNFSMQFCGTEKPMFLDYPEFKGEAGGSPDVVSITNSNTVEMGAEIKCPKDPLVHFRRLLWKTQEDLKKNYKLGFCQIQKLILITKASEWHFISFDDRRINQKEKIKIIEVFPDKRWQDNYNIRLELAIKKKYEIIEQIKANQ